MAKNNSPRYEYPLKPPYTTNHREDGLYKVSYQSAFRKQFLKGLSVASENMSCMSVI